MLQIDELRIRVPGMYKEESSRLGTEVAQLVADALPEDMESRQIPEMNIQVKVPHVHDSNQLAASIAEQIIKQLKLTTL